LNKSSNCRIDRRRGSTLIGALRSRVVPGPCLAGAVSMNPPKPYRTPRLNEKPLIDSGLAVGGFPDILGIKKTAHH